MVRVMVRVMIRVRVMVRMIAINTPRVGVGFRVSARTTSIRHRNADCRYSQRRTADLLGLGLGIVLVGGG